MVTKLNGGPGHYAPARFLCAAFFLGALLVSQQASAQARGRTAPRQAPAAPAPQASYPLPDNLGTSKLLWSTMAAMDHASDTGNFTVVNALGTSGFRSRNTPATLAAVFTTLRNQRVDLSDALLVSPSFELAPHMITPTAFRMRGIFPLRPTSIAFDVVFAWDSGWRLDAIAVLPLSASPGR